jgi:hypothetical protein
MEEGVLVLTPSTKFFLRPPSFIQTIDQENKI